jgi:hypothetical protein
MHKSFIISGHYLDGVKAASLGLGLNADTFIQFVSSDNTQEAHDQARGGPVTAEKAVHWSGRSNLEAGDAGTRNNQMGLPSSGPV